MPKKKKSARKKNKKEGERESGRERKRSEWGSGGVSVGVKCGRKKRPKTTLCFVFYLINGLAIFCCCHKKLTEKITFPWI